MTDLFEETSLVRLEALRSALKRLKSYALPIETRSAVEDAIQTANQLAEQLTTASGQNRLAALYRVSQVLGTTLDLDQVLNQVMDAVIDLTGAERGFLMLVEDGIDNLSLRAARNIDGESLEQKDLEVSRTIIRRVLGSGTGLVSTDAQKDPRFAGQDSIVFFALRSVMCAPLRARGQIIGVVYVDNRAQTGIFTNEDLDLLNAFATQAAIAIENARLYTRTDKALTARVTELETLSQIDKELNEQLDLDRVVEITRRWAITGTGATRSWLVRCEEDGTISLMSLAKEHGEAVLDDALKQSIQAVLDQCEPTTHPPESDKPARLIVPIRCGSGTLFALVVERSEPFGDLAIQFMDRLAGRAAAALENANFYQAVQDANQAKTKFVSVVTHELRIPMTSIKGYTDLLRQGAVGPVNEMQQNFLGVIRNNVERMSALVSDLSDISHIETGRLKLNCSMISLMEYIQETVNNMGPRIREKEQTLNVEVPEDLPQVYADPNRLVQVLTNLVNNANKYTPSGGRILLRVQVNGGFVRVEVTDTGVGITPEDQANLFSQFFRSEDPAVREQQGWGLGLNLTKRLVDLMGGEIGVESVIQEGSTFWFTLSIIQPTDEPMSQ
jgi:signal transduction histidine kinase